MSFPPIHPIFSQPKKSHQSPHCRNNPVRVHDTGNKHIPSAFSASSASPTSSMDFPVIACMPTIHLPYTNSCCTASWGLHALCSLLPLRSADGGFCARRIFFLFVEFMAFWCSYGAVVLIALIERVLRVTRGEGRVGHVIFRERYMGK